MDHHSGLGFLGEPPEVPGMLALLENAILNHRAPVIGIKDHKWVADRTIGQVDGAIGGRCPIVPAAHHDGVDGLSFVLAPMRVLRLFRLPILS